MHAVNMCGTKLTWVSQLLWKDGDQDGDQGEKDALLGDAQVGAHG